MTKSYCCLFLGTAIEEQNKFVEQIGKGGGSGEGKVGKGHGERRPDKQNLMHSKVIKLPGKTPTDIFKQTRIRSEIESKYSPGKKSRTERGFRTLEYLVKIRDGP